MTINDAKLSQEGDSLHATTGPAVVYWMNGAKASGDYTVKATFYEPKYMNLNTHPHPYGVFIGGNDMGTRDQTDLYCAAYGNGKFIVRGFGPAPFKMNGFLGDANEAVHKAAGHLIDVFVALGGLWKIVDQLQRQIGILPAGGVDDGFPQAFERFVVRP